MNLFWGFVILGIIIFVIGSCIYFKINPLEILGDIVEGFLD